MRKQTEKNLNKPENYNKIFGNLLKRDGTFDVSFNIRHKTLLKYFKGGKLLDMGCLNSPLCIIAQGMYPNSEITLLDFAPDVINYFKENYPYKAVLSDCRHTPFEDNTFDYITAGELIEHIPEPKDLVKEAVRILKPGGVFALSTPCNESDNECGGGYHIWSFNPNDIKEMLKPYGKAEVDLLKRREAIAYIIGHLIKD